MSTAADPPNALSFDWGVPNVSVPHLPLVLYPPCTPGLWTNLTSLLLASTTSVVILALIFPNLIACGTGISQVIWGGSWLPRPKTAVIVLQWMNSFPSIGVCIVLSLQVRLGRKPGGTLATKAGAFCLMALLSSITAAAAIVAHPWTLWP
ncbi:hypothetical protein B0H14DRAFT_3531213 [Mycena olivaceomarginata]|nr:hypothetical protein B0H14DRAFT_3531213 [Mycena olivaceomarginata]